MILSTVMATKPDFECSRCASCCRSLLESNDDKILRGLVLTRSEITLFPASVVLPKLGIGEKTSEHTVLYQLAVESCPHLSSQNECQIYADRPLICRSFPILTGRISSRCRVFSYRKPGGIYAEQFNMKDQLIASEKLEKYTSNQIKKHCRKGSNLWEFDLCSKKWINKGPFKV
jgi:Fe-S-cluster containining protein